MRLPVHGKRRDIGLGPFDLVPLAEGRIKAWENRRAVFEGRDALAERRQAKAPTFREAAARTLEGLRSQWRNEKHAAQWATTLETYAHPTLGDQRVDSIRGEDVSILSGTGTCLVITSYRRRITLPSLTVRHNARYWVGHKLAVSAATDVGDRCSCNGCPPSVCPQCRGRRPEIGKTPESRHR